MSHFELRVLPIEQLQPASYNPRKVLKPTSRAYRKLKASIEAFGLVEPLVWNELTGRVVGGHARLGILKELGFAEVPVSVVRLDETREKALNVVLNNYERRADDPDLLAEILSELEPLPELELTGFDEATLASACGSNPPTCRRWMRSKRTGSRSHSSPTGRPTRSSHRNWIVSSATSTS